MSANEIIQDDFIRKQVNLERVKEGSRKRIAGVLNKLEKRILAMVSSADTKTNGQLKKASLDDLFEEIENLVDKTFANEVRGIVEKDLKNVSRTSRMVTKNSINRAAGAEIVDVRTSPQVAQRDFNRLDVQGVRVVDQLQRQADATSTRVIDRINLGVNQGLGVDEIVRSIRGTSANNFKDGLIQTSKNDATRLVRTSINEISNKSALEAFQENNDVIEAIEQVSTLDTRTSDICKAYDGAVWDVNTLEPIPPNNLPFRGGPPRHWNCRSILVPITKSLEDLGISTRKKNQVEDKTEGTRRAFDGDVPESQTYEQWLRNQSEPRQIEALGRKKWELWNQGKLNFRQLVDQRGNALSSDALVQKFE